MKKLFLLLTLLNLSVVYGMEQKKLGEQLLNAAWEGNTEKAIALIRAGANVNFKDKTCFIPLHLAASQGYTETVIALLERGANVNAQSLCGDTPLHEAAYNGHTQTVIALIERGADINAQRSYEITPLRMAAARDCKETVSALVECGADVSVTDKFGDMPLHVAVKKGHTQTAKVLLLADRFKPKTDQQLQESLSRILTFLCCLKIIHNLPHELKMIVSYLPEDIFSADVLAVLLPCTDEKQLAELIRFCPRAWFVQALQHITIPEERKGAIIQEITNYALEQANERCRIKANRGETVYDKASIYELKKLLHPDDPEGVRSAFIREQIEKEFSQESSGKDEEE